MPTKIVELKPDSFRIESDGSVVILDERLVQILKDNKEDIGDVENLDAWAELLVSTTTMA